MDKAEEDFLLAKEISPDYRGVDFNLACIYAIRKEKEKALKYLEIAIKKDPKSKDSAKKDKDFFNIKDTVEFKELVEN